MRYFFILLLIVLVGGAVVKDSNVNKKQATDYSGKIVVQVIDKVETKDAKNIDNDFISINKKHKKESTVRFIDCILLTLLVTFSAIIAGLTIGLMSIDCTNLEILKKSGSTEERKYANLIEPIRKNTHLLLCTLLLSNTVINESLPILLDPIIGSGWKAILCSTAIIVIFGEIIPQAVCTRYGLYIGAQFAWFVQALIYLLLPIAWPIAKLLDKLLGTQHGTPYKRNQLKELVQMHDKELIPEEVRIIKGVLDLRDKLAHTCMTPLNQCFMLNHSTILDKQHIDKILSKGHSRIPIYKDSKTNLVGVLLVKNLISLKHCTPVYKLPISPLPSFSPNLPLFEALSYFQQGKSHIAKIELEEQNAIGILTLEDVMEELLGEQIFDETDEYINIKSKVKVSRQINTQNYNSCFYSPRLSPTLSTSPIPVTNLELEYDNKPISKLKPKTGKDYYQLAQAQQGDIILINTIPGQQILGEVIQPFQFNKRDSYCSSKSERIRSNSIQYDKISPMIVMPKIGPIKTKPLYHLVNPPNTHSKLNNEVANSNTDVKVMLNDESTPLLNVSK